MNWAGFCLFTALPLKWSLWRGSGAGNLRALNWWMMQVSRWQQTIGVTSALWNAPHCPARIVTMSDASFCSNHSLCLIACLSAAFVVKAFSSSDAFSLSLCTSSCVMEYSTGLSAAWTWWSSSQSRSLQVVLTCSITSSHLHRTQLLLWVTDITTCQAASCWTSSGTI